MAVLHSRIITGSAMPPVVERSPYMEPSLGLWTALIRRRVGGFPGIPIVRTGSISGFIC